MRLNKIILSASMAAFTIACSEKKTEIANMNYPETKKVDTVDTYFGTQVSDPYRWLENDTTKETGDWVKAQNEVTFGFLSKIPYRETVKKRLEEIFNYERLSAPFREGDYFYFYKNNGLQNQRVLYRRKGEKGVLEVFLDPNKFKEDGTISLAGISFSKDGSLAAYRISTGGADWTDAIVMRTADK